MTVEVYLNELAHLEGRERSFYADNFDDMRNEKFVRMLLLDGCYVLERFVLAQDVSVEIERDVIYLLSNQIPFHILVTIYDRAGLRSCPLVELFNSYIDHVLEQQGYAVPMQVARHTPSHLLHLLHMHFKPPTATVESVLTVDSGKRVRVRRWRRATEYRMAGVRFRSLQLLSDSTARSILDVDLSGDGTTLKIPQLNVDNETWPMLRNLTALEQDNPEIGSHVTAYCMFMSQVACTAEDVTLLSRKGVLEHQMGDDAQCAKCFGDLCKGVVFDVDDRERNYLWRTCKELDGRFRSRRSNWMALLRRNHFSNPWLHIGLGAAVVTLACAVIQSVYSVLSYYR